MLFRLRAFLMRILYFNVQSSVHERDQMYTIILEDITFINIYFYTLKKNNYSTKWTQFNKIYINFVCVFFFNLKLIISGSMPILLDI